jgi:hypothetical protein
MKGRERAAAGQPPNWFLAKGDNAGGSMSRVSAHDQIALILVRQFPPPFGPNA